MTAAMRPPVTRETVLFIAVAMSSVALVAGWPQLSDQGAAELLAAVVAVAGLPHGALDAWIAKHVGLWRSRRGAVVFHTAYVAATIAIVVGWQAAPAIFLAAFLAISAWHFAGDWPLPAALRPLAGAALLAFPAWHWPGDVTRIFMLLGGEDGEVLAAAIASAGPLLAVALGASMLVYHRRATTAVAELASLAVLAACVPPLVYFGVYFCGLHSPRHMRLVTADTNAHVRRRLWAIAALYTGSALACAAAAWVWLDGSGSIAPADTTLRVLFIGLAGLTVPHMIVVALAERRGGSAI